ncbi:Flp family type IVb pilin [Sphingomonas sp. R647]|uniref:Flp family type IVb pilin n=1 Tax=Sphingomonas sp. R647 TaxID=2875233 RepID=UPI001CD31ED7|nr:Flp family type IVb pilin [Sphingomonas sp. R647]MCA1198879.1 Flp family type IVb pilin [Sphingomonas sp. R647]
MRALKPFLTRLSRCTRGATAVEYGFILALIVLVMIGALTELAGSTTGMWNNVSNKVQNPG